MKKIYHKMLCILPVLTLLTGLSSCLKENTDDCIDPRGNVRVVVRLDAEWTRTSSDTPDVQSVHLFVFDSDDKLIRTIDEQQTYIPGEDYDIWLNLEKGTYRFILWTNLGDQYEIDNTAGSTDSDNPSYSDLRLAFKHANEVTGIIPDLYYGHYGEAIVTGNITNVFPVDMVPDHNWINITVMGISEMTEDTYRFAIEDDNCYYTFENTFSVHPGNGAAFRYVRNGVYHDQTLSANLKILKLAADRTPVFTFKNTTSGQTLFTGDLVGMIKRAYATAGQGGVDFDRTHVFDITLTFDIDMGVTVTINDWEYKKQPNEIG